MNAAAKKQKNGKQKRRSGTGSGSIRNMSLTKLALQFILIWALVTACTFHHFQNAAQTILPNTNNDAENDNYSCSTAKTTAQAADPAVLQREFLARQGSLTAVAYERDDSDSSPVLNATATALKLRAKTIADFCGHRRRTSPSGSRYAVFRDAVLAGRTLFVPAGRINCSEIYADEAGAGGVLLRTRFNPGQGSAPRLRTLVVPEAGTPADLRPHAVCHEYVYEPAVVMAFINWPQYGHAVFNGMSLLWEAAVRGPLRGAGPNVRVYAYADALEQARRGTAVQETWTTVELGALEPVRGLISAQPVRSLANLLLQSERHPVCLSWVLAGISGGTLDHYNFRAPLAAWRDFAQAVRAHFGVPEPPRQDVELQRLVPPDVLSQGEDPAADLGPIRRIDWAALGPDRPRLSILNRRGGRAILNTAELLRVARRTKLFGSVGVVYAEGLDIGDQVRVFGATDVLVGVDGTGLMNGVWMPQGSVVVHVRPFGCAPFLDGKGRNFDRLFAASPGRVLRHESGDRNSTRFPDNIPETAQAAFNSSAPKSYRFSFILKQDTVIDPVAFRCIVEASHRLLRGVAVDWKRHYACTRSVFT